MKKTLILWLIVVAATATVVLGATAWRLETRMERGYFVDQSSPSGETYDLYVPESASPFRKAPLLVMLHGGTQTPEDIALLSDMNVHAEAFGFIVLYPEQSKLRNSGGYWNWFLPQNQIRFGEPAVIVDLVQEVQTAYRIDTDAIFAAGFSAGACMAMNLIVAYPEVFAGVGLVGGLAYGVASTAAMALTAMSGTLFDLDVTSLHAAQNRPQGNRRLLRAIVFHGADDTRVDAANYDYLISQIAMINDWIDDDRRNESVSPTPFERIRSTAANQIVTTRAEYRDASGDAFLVGYLIEGMTHRYPGGSVTPYAFELGPDASRLMIEFFHLN